MITSTTTRVSYDGDGTTATFAVPFKFLADGDLVVFFHTALDYSDISVYVPSESGATVSYSLGDIVRGVHPDHSDNIYRCTVAGAAYISAGPLWLFTPTGTGPAIVTGTVLTWAYVALDSGAEEQTLSTHYTVLGAGDASGGSITFLADYIPEGYETVVIYNDPALTQNVDYVSGDSFPAETHETALDRVTLQQKRTREIAERAPRLPDTDLDGAGAYDARRNRIKNLSAPTRVDDAATKTYVDTAVTNAAFSEPTGIVATGSSTPRDLADRWSQDRNPMDFGAAGTGLVNDSDALQDCLDAVAASGGRMVFPFQKTFLCKNLTFSAVGAFPFIIEGNGSTLKAMSDIDTDESILSNTNVGGIFNDTDVVIRNLTFDGDGVGSGVTRRTASLVILSKISGLLLDHCRITDVEYIGLNAGSRQVLINDCEFDNTGWSRESANGGPAVWIAAATGDGAQAPQDVIVRGCHFHDSNWTGIHFSVTRGIVENCIFHNVKEAALFASYTVHNPVQDVQFINNIIDGVVRHDITGAGIEWTAERFRISGNVIRNCEAQGIALTQCVSGSVSNNVIGNCGRSDVDTTTDMDAASVNFEMDDTGAAIPGALGTGINGTGTGVVAGTQVIDTALSPSTRQDTFVASVNYTTDVVTMTQTALLAGVRPLTFITGGYCISIIGNGSGAAWTEADGMRSRNVTISDNVFYDDNTIPVTRGGIQLSGAGDRIEGHSVRDNIFAPELFNNKQANLYSVFNHTGNMWMPTHNNVVTGNVGLNKNKTKASAAHFPLYANDTDNVAEDQIFVVSGSTSLQKAKDSRAGMKMTIVWGAGATFVIHHEYGGGAYSERFVLKGARDTAGFAAGDSITFECLETVSTLTNCYTVVDSNSVTCDDSTGLKVGMSVSGPAIPWDAFIASKADGAHFEMRGGGGVGFSLRPATATKNKVTLTFIDRVWHEVSRSGGAQDEVRVQTLGAVAAPSVQDGTMFITSGSTTITGLADGWVGQTVTIMAHGAIEIHDNILPGPLSLAGNFVMTEGDTITLTSFEADKWCEISRSNND